MHCCLFSRSNWQSYHRDEVSVSKCVCELVFKLRIGPDSLTTSLARKGQNNRAPGLNLTASMGCIAFLCSE